MLCLGYSWYEQMQTVSNYNASDDLCPSSVIKLQTSALGSIYKQGKPRQNYYLFIIAIQTTTSTKQLKRYSLSFCYFV